MRSAMVSSLVGFSAIMLLMWFGESRAASLNMASLAAYQGGGEVIDCAVISHDAEAVDCAECAPNGGGTFAKCSSTGQNEKAVQTALLSPIPKHESSIEDCGGDLVVYSFTGCTGIPTVIPDGCTREYKIWELIESNPGTCL